MSEQNNSEQLNLKENLLDSKQDISNLKNTTLNDKQRNAPLPIIIPKILENIEDKKYNFLNNSDFFSLLPDNPELKKYHISIYFPTYEPIYHYLNFLTQNRKTSENLDLKSKDAPINQDTEENLNNSEENLDKKSEFEIKESQFVFNHSFVGKLLVFSPPKHALTKFLQIFASLNDYKIYSLNLEYLISKPKQNLDLFIDLITKEFKNKILEKIERESKENFLLLIDFHQITKILESMPTQIDTSGNYISKDFWLYHFFGIFEKIIPITNNMLFIFILSKKEQLETINIERFDIAFKLNLPDVEQRVRLLEKLLVNDLNNIDISHIALQLEGWNIKTIENFIILSKKIYSLLKFQSHTKMNRFDTKFLIDLIESKQYNFAQPSPNIKNTLISNSISSNNLENNNQTITDLSQNQSINKIFEKQLYQNAASQFYEELSISIDKISKGITLTPNERSILGDFPFVLKIEPQKALEKLNKAKLELERIRPIIKK